MTVIDTSAIVAILTHEPERSAYLERLNAGEMAFAVSCYLEAVMVLGKRLAGRRRLDELLDRYSIKLLGSDARQARLAADAFERYGRGSGHPARLNFGDCLAYAAARAQNAPLLFKGEDFNLTDVARIA